MNKEKLLALIAKKEEARNALVVKGDASEDVAELKSLRTEIDGIDAEIRELNELLEALAEDDPEEKRSAGSPVGKTQVLATYTKKAPEKRDESEDPYSTMEYRKAFMDHILRGTPIPGEFEKRDDAFTAVSDAAAVIPTTIMTEVIKEMKVRGQIYSRCRQTNVPGGVRFPILSLKPVASRITESAPSERQKLTMNTYVSFGYLVLECKVATSLLTSVVTLPMFEAQITPLIVEAMVTANEYEVFNGNGTTEMMGILTDTRVAAGQKITLTASEFGEWDSWKKKIFSKVPLAYRSYEIFMGAGTFDGHIDGMVDANGQPIGRTNYGITDGPTYRFGGKTVVEVEEDVIKSYDNASVGDVVAVFADLKEYAINGNMQMAMYRWLDHDTNQYVSKAILINDGKLLDPAGIIIVKKG